MSGSERISYPDTPPGAVGVGRLYNLLMADAMLKYINQWAQRTLPSGSKIYLFGSRACNRAHERSDYDIAISTPPWPHQQWSVAIQNLQEHKPSLHGLDVLWLNQELEDTLSERIQKEKILIYE